jgi:uncharacterized membrane protein
MGEFRDSTVASACLQAVSAPARRVSDETQAALPLLRLNISADIRLPIVETAMWHGAATLQEPHPKKRNPAMTSTPMTSTQADLALAVYDHHSEAETAVKALQRAGFDMKKISIIGKEYETEEHVVGFFNVGDRARIFGAYGAFWGALVGMLFGSAIMFVPVVGHIVVLGPLAATLIGGLEGAVVAGGVSALAGALTAIGIPKDSVLRYETALKANKFILAVHGDAQEIARAQELLGAAGLGSLERPASQPEARAA